MRTKKQILKRLEYFKAMKESEKFLDSCRKLAKSNDQQKRILVIALTTVVVREIEILEWILGRRDWDELRNKKGEPIQF